MTPSPNLQPIQECFGYIKSRLRSSWASIAQQHHNEQLRLLKMKFALIFLMSVLVVATHQYFHDPTREMPWLSPYPSQPFIGKYQPNILFYFRSNPLTSQNGNWNRNLVVTGDARKHLNEAEQSEFPDTQSRVKGFSLDRLVSPDSSEQANNGRFLFNLLSSTGTYTNAFLKTATFTVSLSVSLTSFINCVPSTQVLGAAAATACRRKRSEGSSDNSSMPLLIESDKFPIAPSETLKLVPTVLEPSNEQFHPLLSSKDDVKTGEISADSDLRKKRFFFFDKNQFVVSTTITSYSFSNSTVTITRNLLNPPPAAGVQCAVQAGAPVNPQCIACLPSGYIVCPATG